MKVQLWKGGPGRASEEAGWGLKTERSEGDGLVKVCSRTSQKGLQRKGLGGMRWHSQAASKKVAVSEPHRSCQREFRYYAL